MRIISGSLKNVTISENKVQATHPMSEKLRGAIFNALGDIEGLEILDAFAGTGMVGFEALSRGAKSVDAVEKDDRAFLELQKHAKQVLPKGVFDFRPFHYGVRQFFKKNNLHVYDVMIFDPPYDEITPSKPNIVQTDHIDGMVKFLKPDGIAVFSLPSAIEPLRLPGLKVVRAKTYGAAQLVFYKHE